MRLSSSERTENETKIKKNDAHIPMSPGMKNHMCVTGECQIIFSGGGGGHSVENVHVEVYN